MAARDDQRAGSKPVPSAAARTVVVGHSLAKKSKKASRTATSSSE